MMNAIYLNGWNNIELRRSVLFVEIDTQSKLAP